MAFDPNDFFNVDYKTHHRRFAAPFLIDGNDANNDFFRKEAQQNHIYAVNSALDELIGNAASLTSRGLCEEAERHFRFGALRRLRMISTAFRRFQNIIPPTRTKPLSLAQSDDVARYLNSIYIDLLGLMDNYAWTLTFQFGSAKTRAADKMKIGLFKPILRKDPALADLIGDIGAFTEWEREVKDRRNPAAHRMPLYVPSAALNATEINEYERLDKLASAALKAGNMEAYQDLHARQQNLGTLLPRFLHDPEGPVAEIYPTIPTDIGKAVLIGRLVQTFVHASVTGPADSVLNAVQD